MQRLRARDGRDRRRRCATTTSTVRGCRATRPTRAWPASSAPRWPPARRRACSRTARQRRDFVHVRDVARANLQALHAGTPGAFNVASGTPRGVGEMAAALARAVDPSLAPVVTGQWRGGDVRHVFASPERAATELGFRPSRTSTRACASSRRRGSVPRFAVVGHVEWIEFGRFTHVPEPGEIIDAREWFSEAAGSAAVVAVQLAKLSGDVDFFTALGTDERGRRSRERLEELGVRVHAAPRDAMQRWGFVHLTDDGERTISIVGERHAPSGDDDLPWERLDGADACFVSGGDHAAMRQARRAQLLVATPRAVESLAGVQLDALIGSGKDRLEQVDPDTLDPPPEAGRHHRRRGGRDVAGGRAARGPLRGRRAARPAGRRLRRR